MKFDSKLYARVLANLDLMLRKLHNTSAALTVGAKLVFTLIDG